MTTATAMVPATGRQLELPFDYGLLDDHEHGVVIAEVAGINASAQLAGRGIVDIGRRMLRLRRTLSGKPEKASFAALIKAEFNYDVATAQSFMRVAERFGDVPNIDRIAPQALCLLVAPSTPEVVVREVIREVSMAAAPTVESPVRVMTRADLEQRIQEAKDKAPPQPKQRAMPTDEKTVARHEEVTALLSKGGVLTVPEQTRLMELRELERADAIDQEAEILRQKACSAVRRACRKSLKKLHLLVKGFPQMAQRAAPVKVAIQAAVEAAEEHLAD